MPSYLLLGPRGLTFGSGAAPQDVPTEPRFPGGPYASDVLACVNLEASPSVAYLLGRCGLLAPTDPGALAALWDDPWASKARLWLDGSKAGQTLLVSAPALVFLLTARAMDRGWGPSQLDPIARMKPAEILSLCGVNRGALDSAERVCARIDVAGPRHGDADDIVRLLNSERALHTLQPWPRVSLATVRVLAAMPEADLASIATLLERPVAGGSLAQMALLLECARARLDGRGLAELRSDLARCEHMEAALRHLLEATPFAAPPLAGTRSISPISNLEQLAQEAQRTGHHRLTSFRYEFMRGTRAVYRVTARERATVMLKYHQRWEDRGSWEVEEIRGPNNQSVGSETTGMVREWVGRGGAGNPAAAGILW